MRQPRPAEVEWVRPGSPAASAGIESGHRVVRVNGRAPRDYIDYRYLTAAARVALTVENGSGQRRRVTVTKPVDADLGMRFTRDVFDGIRTCGNRCGFCFVDQLPRGLRPALYVRDDDYRLSFLHGTFITLTNLSAADRARIVRLHLSPLYVSVHATERGVRERMFGGPTRNVTAEMERLAARGIELHVQIVVCPGLNDGCHLEKSVHDLASLYPGVRSIGVVPVGLTRHRRRLPPLRPVTKPLAREIVGSVRRWQRGFAKELGTRLVFAADELYLLAGLRLLGRAHYEQLPQLANGIGGVRLFLDAVRRMRPVRLRRRLRATLVTGEAAAGFVRLLADRLAAGGSVRAEVCVVPNRLLGRSVTTAGLLAGGDILSSLRGRELGHAVLVPAAAIREGEGFLDGMTVEQLAESLGVPVLAAGSPGEAAAVLRRFDRARKGR